MNTNKPKAQIRKKGAVLLISILVASVALTVGFGVYNRTYKELLFASFWRQTQIAFLSADAGLECAMFWQIHPAYPASCFGHTIIDWTPGQAGTFDLDIPDSGCVNIRIAWDGTATTTEARGYNKSCLIVNTGTDPRIVERGFSFSL